MSDDSDEKKRDQDTTQLELQVATEKTVESTLGGGGFREEDEFSDSDDELTSSPSQRRGTLLGKRLKVFSSWECITWHVFLLIFLIMISLGRTNADLNYTQTSAVKSKYIDSMTYDQTFGAGEKTFEEIAQFQDWYNYLRVVFEMAFKEAFDSGVSYEDAGVEESKWYNSINGARLLGGIRMRQTRFKREKCKNTASSKFEHCHDFASEDRKDWRGARGNMSRTYEYETADDLDDQLWRAKFNTYPGGGYVHDFALNQSEALAELAELEAGDWLDDGTQLVLIDFNLFNPSTKLHTVARIAVEISAGGFFPYFEIKSWMFDRFKSDVAAGYIFCLCAVASFILWFTVLMVREMWREGVSCYAQDSYWTRTGWRYLDVMNLTIFYATIIAFAVNVSLTKSTDLYSTDSYVSLRRIQYAFLTEVMLLASNGFLCFFKIFKYFSANERLRFFFTMMQRASGDILLFCLVLVVFFLAFGSFGFLAFSSDLDDFRSVTFAFFNMMRFVVSELPYENLANSSRSVGSAYFVLWSLLMALVLANVFIALLSEAYGEVRSELNKKPNEGLFGLFAGRVDKMADYVKALAMGRHTDVDADGDGQVDLDELMKKTEWPEDKARAFIEKYDVDGNGTLSNAEWKIMQKRGDTTRFDEEWVEIKRRREDALFDQLAGDPMASPMVGAATLPLKDGDTSFPMMQPLAAGAMGGGAAVTSSSALASGAGMSKIELMRLRDKMFLLEDMLRLVIKEGVDNGEGELEKIYRRAERRSKRRTKMIKKTSMIFGSERTLLSSSASASMGYGQGEDDAKDPVSAAASPAKAETEPKAAAATSSAADDKETKAVKDRSILDAAMEEAAASVETSDDGDGDGDGDAAATE